jgi:hypothetical protein
MVKVLFLEKWSFDFNMAGLYFFEKITSGMQNAKG